MTFTVVSGFLLGASSCGPTTVIAPINITVSNLGGTSTMTTTVEVTRIDKNGSCEYRLEHMPPDDKIRGINEIGGDRGTAQRINSCAPTPPSFAATATSNAAWFEEQSTYYWAKKSRDYAKAAIWNTPPGWEGGPITLGNAEVSLNVLSTGGPTSGFLLACAPRGTVSGGCMRYWPGQNPKIYIPAGAATGNVVGHEMGHYAAGYAFGHQETLSSGGFKIDNCVHRAFQEGIAEVFLRLFVHHERTTTGSTRPPSGTATLNTQWSNDCTGGEYVMSNPLWEAFTQAVWGIGMDKTGAPVTVPWPDAATANTAVADAFTYALLTVKDFRMHDFAVATVTHIGKLQPAGIAGPVETIFAGHGLTMNRTGEPCIENQECLSNYCDNGENTSRTRLCLPAGSTGQGGDPCTNNNQCATTICSGASQNATGNWVPGACTGQGALGAGCNSNNQCVSTYCDAGFNTANTNRCMPRGTTGQDNDPCSHSSQCASGACAGLSRDANGNWVPGRCVAQGALGASCKTNSQCTSTYCDAGFNTAQTNKCMPRGGEGRAGDQCTHNTQCASADCRNLTQGADGNWIPGSCR
jgi:hypothetical protein